MDTLGYSVTRSYWSIFQYAVTSCRANDRPGLEDRRTNGIPELSMVSLEFPVFPGIVATMRQSGFSACIESKAFPWMGSASLV